jgi:hypothetical protein
MGITVRLVGVWPHVVDSLRRYPTVLDLVLTCGGRVATLRERAAEGASDRLLLCGADPVELARFVADPGLDELERCTRGEVDIDRTWAGIHFLLTGEPEPGGTPSTTPLGWALGGSEPAVEGTPYEVAPRVVGEQAVASVSAALSGIDTDELRRRFDPDALADADVYPPRLWHQPDALDDLLTSFGDLVWFYRRAAALGRAVLICTTL